MSEVIFEDNFDAFNPENWEVKGNHTNFNVTTSDGWLHMLFSQQSSEPGIRYRWASVCTRNAMDLSNKQVCVRYDLIPKLLQPQLPMDEYFVGIMLANKKDIQGNPLINPDLDLKAVVYAIRMQFQVPIQKTAWVIDRGIATRYYGAAFLLYPPAEFEIGVGLTKVITYEEGVEDITLPLPADPTSLYVHLFVFQVEFVTSRGQVYLLPSRASFDYLRVIKGPIVFEYPKPEQVMAQTLPQVLSAIMVIMMVSLLLRVIGRM